jgi:pilus assembly protein CpaB
MAKKRTFLLLMIALVLGLAAAWLANDWILKRTLTPALASDDTLPVVVAALEIPLGQQIEGAHIKTVSMPRSLIPNGAFNAAPEVTGRIATQPLLPGEILLEGRVVEHLGGSALSSIVNQKMRAVTVRVNDVIGVAGFLLPGNRVDVLASRKENRRSVTRTLLQDLKVLAVDQTASTDKNEPVIVRAVTLEMTPKDAEKLVGAREEGSIQLTLRNPGDDSLVSDPPPKNLAKRSPPAPRPSVTIIRGTSVNRAHVQF